VFFFRKYFVSELTSPQDDQSVTWLTASWFVDELSSKLLKYSWELRLMEWGLLLVFVLEMNSNDLLRVGGTLNLTQLLTAGFEILHWNWVYKLESICWVCFNVYVKTCALLWEQTGGSSRVQHPQRPFDFTKYNTRHVALKIAYLGWDYQVHHICNFFYIICDCHIFRH